MENGSKAAAEARLQKVQKAHEASKAAWTHYESEARASEAKTARLKQERLDRDAAAASAGAVKRKPPVKKKPATKRGVGSY